MTRTTYDDGELESVVLLSGRGTNNSFFIIESSVSCFLPSQSDVFKLFWSNEADSKQVHLPISKTIYDYRTGVEHLDV